MTAIGQGPFVVRCATRFLVAVIAALAAILLGLTAPASATVGAETRVGAINPVATALVGAPAHITAGQRLGKATPGRGNVVATGVAADTAAEAASVRMVSHPGGVVELFGTSAEGAEIQVMANMTRSGSNITLSELHAEGAGANTVGTGALRGMLRQWGKEQGAETITIRGGARTTGPKLGQVHEFTFPVQ